MPSPRTVIVPSLRELAALARFALINAQDLIEDAQLLLEAGRYPRAFALATLAGEEVGKHYLCVSATGFDPRDLEFWSDFWKKFRTHDRKLRFLGGYMIDMSNLEYATWKKLYAELPADARAEHEAKMAALYVDFSDGEARLPRDIVPEAETRLLFDAVAMVVSSLNNQWGDADLGELFERTAPALRAMRGAMLRAREADDWQAAKAVLLDVLRTNGAGLEESAAAEELLQYLGPDI